MDFLQKWLENSKGLLRGAYTEALDQEYQGFAASLTNAKSRFVFGPASVPHDEVVQNFLSGGLRELPKEWHYSDR